MSGCELLLSVVCCASGTLWVVAAALGCAGYKLRWQLCSTGTPTRSAMMAADAWCATAIYPSARS